MDPYHLGYILSKAPYYVGQLSVHKPECKGECYFSYTLKIAIYKLGMIYFLFNLVYSLIHGGVPNVT
jgi:hypothetical protein